MMHNEYEIFYDLSEQQITECTLNWARKGLKFSIIKAVKEVGAGNLSTTSNSSGLLFNQTIPTFQE